jgi:hypothetical protein
MCQSEKIFYQAKKKRTGNFRTPPTKKLSGQLVLRKAVSGAFGEPLIHLAALVRR